MGYNHYWSRPAEIGPESFRLMVKDFQRCILSLDDLGVPLAGPTGCGLPRIGSNLLAFNGVSACGHPKNEEICIPFPSEYASGVGSSIDAIVGPWFIGVEIRRRTCNGSCSYEPFILSRVIERDARDQSEPDPGKRLFEHCKTGFRPYDLAVQCALLIGKHHLEERLDVWSGGSDWHWQDARRVCYLCLGHPLARFRMDRDRGLIEG
jgi:hypothetical protein